MRRSAIWLVVLFTVAVTAGSYAAGPPREVTLDLGGGVKLEMVLIPAGQFVMGSPDAQHDAEDERPQHRVRITRPFYLGKYLVTQAQWQAVMGSNPSSFRGDANPVEQVSWEDCRLFAQRLSAKLGGGKFSLPSEAQWEYACRAGSTTRYSFGDQESELRDYGWYVGNSRRTTHPVGQKRPNAWGLYDVHGNVWEWCADVYDTKYYRRSPVDDPPGPAEGADRVARGGGWPADAGECRSASRITLTPGRPRYVGLRVCRAAE
jgi:formylglycine-generating enzyme required for sulfatase activity